MRAARGSQGSIGQTVVSDAAHRRPAEIPGGPVDMPVTWRSASEYSDIRYELSTGEDAGIAKITINRPEVRNAFRPETVVELSQAFERAREDLEVGVVILTGEGPDAFCSGGDQRVRGDAGYVADDAAGARGVGRFHVSDLHVQIRRT